MIRFFGEADRQGKKKTGAIRSEYPTWYHPAQGHVATTQGNCQAHPYRGQHA